MKPVKFIVWSLVVAAAAILAAVLIGPASAAGNFGHSLGLAGSFQPQEVEGCPEGYVCLTVEEYAALIEGKESCEQLYTPTPTSTQPPGDTPTPPPEATPTTPPEATPTPEDKEKCNRGIGNLEEGCDPGNSFGQGKGDGRPAGEDRHESEGPPGNKHESHGGPHNGKK